MKIPDPIIQYNPSSACTFTQAQIVDFFIHLFAYFSGQLFCLHVVTAFPFKLSVVLFSPLSEVIVTSNTLNPTLSLSGARNAGKRYCINTWLWQGISAIEAMSDNCILTLHQDTPSSVGELHGRT